MPPAALGSLPDVEDWAVIWLPIIFMGDPARASS